METNFKNSSTDSAIQKKVYVRICSKCNNQFQTFCKHGTTCFTCWTSSLSNRDRFFPKKEEGLMTRPLGESSDLKKNKRKVSLSGCWTARGKVISADEYPTGLLMKGKFYPSSPTQTDEDFLKILEKEEKEEVNAE